jgi:uncharacterized RDD family membrane protein YckC
MNWYYVQQGKQAGPVTNEQLDEMVRGGSVTADTLVWREGLAEWTPYSQAKSGAAPGQPGVAAEPGPEAVCAECGKLFPLEETISHGNVRICAACKPVFLQKLREGAAINTGTMHYAGFWIRVAAKLLDGLILGVPFGFVVGILVVSQFHGHTQPLNAGPTFNLLVVVLEFGFVLVFWAYQIFFLGKYGATPGKMACKIKVVTGEGEKISYLRATGRMFAEMLSGMICYIGYIMVGFDGQKRGLHDHICNTRVIYTNR